MSVDFTSVQLVDVSRHFGRRRALSKINLTLRSGDIVGLLGPNGAGKSTLITILATLATPTSGEVRVDAPPDNPPQKAIEEATETQKAQAERQQKGPQTPRR